MQILIDIPEDVIESAKSNPNYYPTYHFEKIWRAIANGKLLPKGHGRLIDANDLMAKMVDFCVVYDEIMEIPTILEAKEQTK